MMGYLGGINWAILVARVCQLYVSGAYWRAAILQSAGDTLCNVWYLQVPDKPPQPSVYHVLCAVHTMEVANTGVACAVQATSRPRFGIQSETPAARCLFQLLCCFFPVLLGFAPTLCVLLSQQVWDPKQDARDRSHVMPVITPVYPNMNSAYNVSPATLRVMQTEFKRGYALAARVKAGTSKWEAIFQPVDFFGR